VASRGESVAICQQQFPDPKVIRHVFKQLVTYARTGPRAKVSPDGNASGVKKNQALDLPGFRFVA
jgi:hypothetical protein